MNYVFGQNTINTYLTVNVTPYYERTGSAERILLWFKGEVSVCASRLDPTRPDLTCPCDAFEKLVSLERVDRFTSGLLCSMSRFNKFRV